jgi:hypothetical protein
VKGLAFVIAVLMTCLSTRAEDERVLFCGFEKEKLLEWTKLAKEEGDLAHVILPGDRGRAVYTMKKGVATEGEWSLLVSAGADEPPDLKETPHFGRTNYPKWACSYIPWKPRYKSSVSLKPGRLANLLDGPEFTRAIDRFGHRLESGSHHKLVLLYTGYAEWVVYPPEAFPRDWSGFSFLRLDVFPEKGELEFRVATEDDKVAPAVEKRFVVPAGKWSTLQIDLDEAVRERSLDLARMVNFWTHWEETSAPTRIYVDNIRLSRKDVKARYPVLRGAERHPRPLAEMPVAAKVEPVLHRLTLGEPISMAMGKIPPGPRFWRGYGQSNRYLRLWAYDNQRMLLEYSALLFCCTVDGGKTWKRLGDRGWMPMPPGAPADPQASSVMDREGNVLFVGEWGPCIYHCCPPLDSLCFRKLVMTRDGWTPSPFYVIASESRHCAAGRRMIVLPSGRIWLAYRVSNRGVAALRTWRRKGSIHAVYSDDGGKTWRGAGVKGKLTGTLADTLVGGTDARESPQLAWKRFCDPLSLTPYGDHVAVTWNENTRPMRGMYWSYFDGVAWSAPAKVDSRLATFSSIPPKDKRYSTVTLDGKRIFISTDKGIITWDGSKWTDDAGSPPKVLLTVSGGKLFGVSWDEKTLRFWQRLGAGRWESQELFAAKDKEIFLVAMPPASPPNFVPVAWCCIDPKSRPAKGKAQPDTVSILRVPVQ